MSSNIQPLSSSRPPVSFTLPIHCQICLGKVSDPSTCCNQHVFCDKCINTWLDRQNRCPVCRVEITPQSPIKPIIGGSLKSDKDDTDSRETQRELRKTRIDLVIKDYDEDVQDLENTIKALRKDLENAVKSGIPTFVELQKQEVVEEILDPPKIVHNARKTELSFMNLTVQPQKLESSSSQSSQSVVKSEDISVELENLKQENRGMKMELAALKNDNLKMKEKLLLMSPTKLSRFSFM